MLSGVLDAGLVPAAEVGVVDLAPERRAEFAKRGCQVSEDLKSLAGAKTTVLAVKPWLVDEVASGLGATQERVVSVMAGVPASTLHRAFGGGCRVVRTMPNTPCLLRQGVTGIAAGPGSTPEDIAYVAKMFRELGGVVEVDESLLDAVTAVSGSGPAWFFRFVEAAGESRGRSGLVAGGCGHPRSINGRGGRADDAGRRCAVHLAGTGDHARWDHRRGAGCV